MRLLPDKRQPTVYNGRVYFFPPSPPSLYLENRARKRTACEMFHLQLDGKRRNTSKCIRFHLWKHHIKWTSNSYLPNRLKTSAKIDGMSSRSSWKSNGVITNKEQGCNGLIKTKGGSSNIIWLATFLPSFNKHMCCPHPCKARLSSDRPKWRHTETLEALKDRLKTSLPSCRQGLSQRGPTWNCPVQHASRVRTGQPVCLQAQEEWMDEELSVVPIKNKSNHYHGILAPTS